MVAITPEKKALDVDEVNMFFTRWLGTSGGNGYETMTASTTHERKTIANDQVEFSFTRSRRSASMKGTLAIDDARSSSSTASRAQRRSSMPPLRRLTYAGSASDLWETRRPSFTDAQALVVREGSSPKKGFAGRRLPEAEGRHALRDGGTVATRSWTEGRRERRSSTEVRRSSLFNGGDNAPFAEREVGSIVGLIVAMGMAFALRLAKGAEIARKHVTTIASATVKGTGEVDPSTGKPAKKAFGKSAEKAIGHGSTFVLGLFVGVGMAFGLLMAKEGDWLATDSQNDGNIWIELFVGPLQRTTEDPLYWEELIINLW